MIKARFYRVSIRFTYINKYKLIDCFSISREGAWAGAIKAEGRNGAASVGVSRGARQHLLLREMDFLGCK